MKTSTASIITSIFLIISVVAFISLVSDINRDLFVKKLEDNLIIKVAESDKNKQKNERFNRESIDYSESIAERLKNRNTWNQLKNLPNTQIEKSKIDPALTKNGPKSLINNEASKIAYYLYDYPETNWYSTCRNNLPWLNFLDPFDANSNHYQHSDDIVFGQKIQDHPWRVENPEQADVFVFPFLIGMFLGYGGDLCGKCHYFPNSNPVNLQSFEYNRKNLFCGNKQKLLSFDDMIRNVEDFSENNSIYKKFRYSKPHLFVNSHWWFDYPGFKKVLKNYPKFEQMMRDSNVGVYETMVKLNYDMKGPRVIKKEMLDNFLGKGFKNPQWRASVIVPYVDWPLLQFNQLDHFLHLDNFKKSFKAWKKRPIDLFFNGRITKHHSYKTRDICSTAMKSKHLQKYTYVFGTKHNFDTHHPRCHWDQCYDKLRCSECRFSEDLQKKYREFVMNSKFSLMIHGDTATSSRLYDAITNGLIPIIISPDIYSVGLPFVQRVPWREIAFFVPLSYKITQNPETYAKYLQGILSSPEDLLQHKYKNLLQFRKEVSWLHPESRVVENLLISAKNDYQI